MTQVARPAEDTYRPVPPPNGSTLDAWRNELGEVDFPIFESINTFLPNDLTYGEANPLLPPKTLPQDSVPYVTRLTEVQFTETADQGLTVRTRLAKDEEGDNRVDCLVELREEYNNEITDKGILIATATFENIGGDFAEYSFKVTPAQARNILDFGALYLRFMFTVRIV